MSDFKSEAERLIKFAEASGSEAAAMAATAHATLYLADQQRIANLLSAFWQKVLTDRIPSLESYAMSDGERDFFERQEIAAHAPMLTAIREGLGL